MRLTRQRGRSSVLTRAWQTPVPRWAHAAIPLALALVFLLDRATEAAPVQHLYYVPIALAAVWLGARGALVTSSIAILLYHLANPSLMNGPYKDTNLVQIALFLLVGLVTARVARDTRQLQRLAATDDLTGLHNLRSFEIKLTAAIVSARRSGAPFSLLVLDLDRLKSLNDVHGHLAGAEAVRLVGRVLAERLPAHACACRYGGDEFVVALPGFNARDASQVADDIRRTVHELAPVLAGTSFSAGALAVSIGVAGLHESGAAVWQIADATATGEALFQAADRALYEAKRAGRNCVSGVDTFSAA